MYKKKPIIALAILALVLGLGTTSLLIGSTGDGEISKNPFIVDVLAAESQKSEEGEGKLKKEVYTINKSESEVQKLADAMKADSGVWTVAENLEEVDTLESTESKAAKSVGQVAPVDGEYVEYSTSIDKVSEVNGVVSCVKIELKEKVVIDPLQSIYLDIQDSVNIYNILVSSEGVTDVGITDEGYQYVIDRFSDSDSPDVVFAPEYRTVVSFDPTNFELLKIEEFAGYGGVEYSIYSKQYESREYVESIPVDVASAECLNGLESSEIFEDAEVIKNEGVEKSEMPAVEVEPELVEDVATEEVNAQKIEIVEDEVENILLESVDVEPSEEAAEVDVLELEDVTEELATQDTASEVDTTEESEMLLEGDSTIAPEVVN